MPAPKPPPMHKPAKGEARQPETSRATGASTQKERIRSLLAAASEKLALNPVEASVLADEALQIARSTGDLPLHGEAALSGCRRVSPACGLAEGG